MQIALIQILKPIRKQLPSSKAGQQAYANQAQQQITDAITIAEHPDYVPKHD